MDKDQLEILEDFVVENDDLEKLESLLADFNIFEAIGAVRQELRHSDFLAFLMNPNSNHGLGDLFLKRFLRQVAILSNNTPLGVIDVDVADWSDTEVRREWRNIDILVYNSTNQMVCAIENKVGSKEHSNQTTRYNGIVTHDFPDCKSIFVFLTPEGETPQDDRWISYTYDSILKLTSEICQSHKSSLGPDVYTLLSHYVALLGRHIVSDTEIARLCQQIYKRHRTALDLIYEHRPDMQSEIGDFLKQLIADEKRIELDHCSKSYVRFAVKKWDKIKGVKTGGGWTPSMRIPLFEFRNAPSSLNLCLIVGPGDSEVRENFFNIAKKNRTLFRSVSRKLYDKWTQIYKLPILKTSDYEDSDMERFENLIRVKWAQFLENELPRIEDKIESEI